MTFEPELSRESFVCSLSYPSTPVASSMDITIAVFVNVRFSGRPVSLFKKARISISLPQEAFFSSHLTRIHEDFSYW